MACRNADGVWQVLMPTRRRPAPRAKARVRQARSRVDNAPPNNENVLDGVRARVKRATSWTRRGEADSSRIAGDETMNLMRAVAAAHRAMRHRTGVLSPGRKRRASGHVRPGARSARSRDPRIANPRNRVRSGLAADTPRTTAARFRSKAVPGGTSPFRADLAPLLWPASRRRPRLPAAGRRKKRAPFCAPPHASRAAPPSNPIS